MFVEHVAQWMMQAMGGTENETMYTLLVFLAAFLLVWSIQCFQYNMKLPPGPWGLPFFGYLPFLDGHKHLHLQFGRLAKNYGPMFSARLGNQLLVVLSDYHAIRDTFRREEFTARPQTEFFTILGGYGIINSEGALWKEQRRFLHEKLRSFGMTYMGSGKKVMESRIMREVDSFLRGLSSKQGNPVDVSPSLGMSISNVICSILMGIRFQQGDTRFERFMYLIEEGFKLFGSMASVNFIPIMRYLPCLMKVRSKISANRAEMGEFFQETVDQHRTTFNENEIRDLVDAYLLEIKKAKSEGNEAVLFHGKDHDQQMQQILGDLFSAGMETVKTTLEWAFVMMLHHPDAAKAVQEELDQVVGRSRMPALEDLPFLPITEATILEVLRRSSIVPLGTTHATTRDVMLNGYKIPAGSQVVPLLHAVHMDPKLWEKPDEFRPARFLSAEGKVTKPEYFMPFGVGRRMCLGDVLARMELFLFFSSLLHSFDLRLPDGENLPSLAGNAGITVTPDPFKVCLVQRRIEQASNDNAPTGVLRNVGSH
ncbi:cytochrome P450 18a1 [Prorops nasuta]|uniref:cytochrome P450 18a1 n=1 Tax=Prorops nasuta TaxID=863751 RepID=UPI0034CE283F